MKLIIMSLVLLSMNAFATDIKLLNSQIRPDDYEIFISGHFEINKELGRAWVELGFSTGDAESHTMPVRVKVPGLIYDKQTGEVVLETSSGRVICAKEKKFLGMKTLKETKECSFVQKKYTTTYDDGFEIKEIQNRTIFLHY